MSNAPDRIYFDGTDPGWTRNAQQVSDALCGAWCTLATRGPEIGVSSPANHFRLAW